MSPPRKLARVTHIALVNATLIVLPIAFTFFKLVATAMDFVATGDPGMLHPGVWSSGGRSFWTVTFRKRVDLVRRSELQSGPNRRRRRRGRAPHVCHETQRSIRRMKS